ncbi:hypothetical protein GCM10008090_16990 [Arenicella chitinivorans]|uniref:Uncharacterized protein n=2 Tax=Arenicella chitinivorans TaxID=1329800 RepID=A0A918VLB7_9GAMM|nr:hypothetical protein GCM10008090_16990 [Arenicella chitinivorans]
MASAQNKVVVVPLFDSSPTGVGAIPVYCREVVLSKNASESDNVTCYRSDTRQPVIPVPQGHMLMITDMFVVGNALFESDRTASISYGRDGGGVFPAQPSHRLRFQLGRLNHMSMSTPYLVLHGGESMLAYNGDVSTTGASVNVSFSGYLIQGTTFGN